MSNLRNRLAGVREDLGPEKFEAAQNGVGKIHTMTLFLLPELGLFSKVEGLMGMPISKAKEEFMTIFKDVNSQYSGDEDVSVWSDAKVRELELKVGRCRNFFDIVNLVEYSGLAQVALNSNGITQIAKTLNKIASLRAK